MTGVLPLDDPRCRSVAIAGAKAAWLARARGRGLPVLDGVVVPAGRAVHALRAGQAALQAAGDRHLGGSGGARLAAMAVTLDDALREALEDAVERLGPPVIVRSSAAVEGGGEWAGAFSSFADVDVDQVDTAVRGCWASAFTVDALERGEAVGTAPDDLGLAVLLQPQINPQWAGTARVVDDAVEVAAVRGSPAALLSGWARGSVMTVAVDGTVTDQRVAGSEGGGTVPPTVVQAAAELCRQARTALDGGVVEWAWTDRGPVLLQVQPAPGRIRRAMPMAPPRVTPRPAHPDLERVARIAVAFPGAVCEELVLPWLLGVRDLDGLLAVTLERDGDPTEEVEPPGVEALRHRAAALAARVWGLDATAATAAARRLLQHLRGGDPHAAGRLQRLTPPPLDEAVAILRQLLALGGQLAASGRLRTARDVLHLRPRDLWGPAVGHQRHGPGRWEPFLVEVAEAGQRLEGAAAAPGQGAGVAQPVGDPTAPPPDRLPRRVVVAAAPVPLLGSLLFDAAALVTCAGSTGAHLLEVARSLGVPAVVGADVAWLLEEPRPDAWLVSVDGDAGVVHVHDLRGQR